MLKGLYFLPYWIGFSLCWLLFTFLFRWKIFGGQNIPRKGPVIIGPNHVSHLDPPLIGTAVSASVFPRPVWFMAKSDLFKVPFLGWLIRHMRAYPVKRGQPDKVALRRSLALLDQGEMIVVFPEGTRSPDGRLQEPELGAAFLALRTGAPVIPCAISGSNKALSPGSFLIRPAHIVIQIGKPLYFCQPAGQRVTREHQKEVAKEIMAAIAALQERR